MRLRPLALPCLALAALTSALACREPSPSIASVVRTHLERYPEAGLADIYSTLLHGALGPAHGTRDSVAAARWLSAELASLKAGPPEPLIEDIAGDTSVVRINLRPFVALGGNGDSLLAAFLRSGQSVTPRPFRLAHALRELGELADAGTLPWSGDSLRRFVAQARVQDHDLLPHSEAYLAAYRPAYRVLARADVARAISGLTEADWFAEPKPPFPTGRFVDDYGSTHEVSATEWLHGSYTRMRIRAWHPSKRYLLAQTVASAPTDSSAERWVRLEWIPLEMAPWSWAYCLIAYDAQTAAEAEANESARPETPRTGCGRFPFTRLRVEPAAP